VGLCAQYRDEMKSWASLEAKARPPVHPRNAMGPGPRNSLHWAVALSVPEQVVHFVTNNTYPINALSPRSWTAVHFAAKEGNMKVLKTLLTAPGVNLLIREDDGMTPLHIAARLNNVGVVKLLLQREPKLLGIRDNGGRTAWLWAAAQGNADVLKVLKGAGQDVNDATKGGWNALHLAGESDRVSAVKYLVTVGTRKDARIKEGRRKGCTPKQLAVQKGKTAVLEFL
jgi:ankyrin repeat protein